VTDQGGAPSNPYAAPDSGPTTESSVFATSEKSGVGGWLLVLCLVLTVAYPLAAAYRVMSRIENLPLLGSILPGMGVFVVGDAIVSVALALGGIAAGIAMWRIRPRAVTSAKAFLLGHLVYAVVSGGVPFVLGTELPERIAQEILGAWIFNGGCGLLFTSFWMAYLTRSRRVARTYGLPMPEDG